MPPSYQVMDCILFGATADITGRTVEVLDTEEAASLGGAMLAGIAAVYRHCHRALRTVDGELTRIFPPDG